MVVENSLLKWLRASFGFEQTDLRSEEDTGIARREVGIAEEGIL
jgi:hypothetical protein